MNPNTIKIENKGKTQIIAHRGVSGLEKENTHAAFVAAGNRSYFGIESDVHRTADGKFVMIHDDDTARVAIDKLPVEETTYETLRALRLTDMDGKRGRSDLRIPSLSEYVSICKKYGKIGVLELKNAFSVSDILSICEEIDAQDYFNSMIFISFCYDNLVLLKRNRPEAEAQFLTVKFTEDLVERLTEYDLGLDIYYKYLTAENVALCHENGICVNCWTVDSAEDAAMLIGYGVDYITSNILE